MRKSEILITCPKGFSPYLTGETEALGFPVLSASHTGVLTGGDMADAMRLNLHIRTGHRVLFKVGGFKAKDADDLYGGISAIKWEDFISEDGYVCVTSKVQNPTIKDSRYSNLVCKDAVVDRIRRLKGRRPDSGPERHGAVVDVYWAGEDASVYLDTSGEPLSNRGYRKIPLGAPLRESLSAALLMAAGWKGEGNFVNPMCGSGTLAVEAVLIALGRAPGLLRENFSFMHLKGFDKTAWESMKQRARTLERKTLRGKVIATDINPRAVESAMKNSEAAGVIHLMDFKVCDFRETPVPEEGGIVMLNPGYGKRMGSEGELSETYRAIGDFFKKKCTGYRGYIFTGNPGLSKAVSLRTKRRLVFYNGPIECRLLQYELYEGTKEEKQKQKSG